MHIYSSIVFIECILLLHGKLVSCIMDKYFTLVHVHVRKVENITCCM